MTVEELKARFPKVHFEMSDDYLAKVLAFAESRGLRDQLMEQIGYAAFEEFFGEKAECWLFSESPYSFYVELRVNGKVGMNAGLIYFGAGDTGVGAPQFSCRLGDTTKEGWEIHS